jgi:hypothetical protein
MAQLSLAIPHIIELDYHGPPSSVPLPLPPQLIPLKCRQKSRLNRRYQYVVSLHPQMGLSAHYRPTSRIGEKVCLNGS